MNQYKIGQMVTLIEDIENDNGELLKKGTKGVLTKYGIVKVTSR